ncbi:MAG: polysaccharide biosynthesis tyrosine autokinase [Prevotella sp.]|nr:polysaccharide biosynthesis tyrosine autokinase [Candidatus Prevotella equi]
MAEIINQAATAPAEQKSEKSLFNIQFLLKTFLLNWQWFILSVVVSLGLAFVYLRYTAPIYQVTAKILVKDEDNKRSYNNKIAAATNLGIMNSSDGFDNELELIQSVTLAEDAVKDLKLYVSYFTEGTVGKTAIYRTNPIIVDMDALHLNALEKSVEVNIKKASDGYTVTGQYIGTDNKSYSFEKNGSLPMSINTPVGIISLKKNLTAVPQPGKKEPDNLIAIISNPTAVGTRYTKAVNASPLSKTTTIISLSLNDVVPDRAIDYLKQLSVVYNRQANDIKNQIAVRTEEFIDQRLKKINSDLGSTDGAIESFKRQNGIIDPTSIANNAVSNSDDTDKKLVDIQTQITLLKSIKEYMLQPSNKYQTLPSNVGLTDNAAVTLIGQYNIIAINRNRLLQTASELSPRVQEYTTQMDNLTASINGAVNQAMKSLELQRDAIMRQYGKYSGMMAQAPQQERVLTEIGRQQSVKSSLYIMLLQKREENSIELAATADKGRLIDEPVNMGKVSPKKPMILLIALILGFGLPLLVFFIIEFLRFRIEGHEDVQSLTTRPIIADIAMANDKIKTRGDIVVHENTNNQMEEIFRGLRTNIQFMLKENEKVIMFTSSTSGEGKTFTAANLAVSFALLGKKVVLVGLDIRRPRLSSLFDINNEINGITPLLSKEEPTMDDIRKQIVPSEVNKNLDLLMAGPIPPNPAELISRKSLDAIFEELKKAYDYIIVDTAPVGLVTDTLQLGRIANVTVVMCRADYTERSAFQLINELSESGKLPNICIAINGIDMSKKKHSYSYGYGKYGKYGKYGANSYGYKSYGTHSYGYGSYSNSHYGNPNDDSIKK